MSDTAMNTDSASTFKTGYTSKQVGMAIVFAFLLHGAMLGAYFIMGGEKKQKVAPPAAAAAPAGDATKGGDPAKGDVAPPKPDAAEAPKKAPGVDTKKDDVAKPSEIPKGPDSDIDSILKAK